MLQVDTAAARTLREARERVAEEGAARGWYPQQPSGLPRRDTPRQVLPPLRTPGEVGEGTAIPPAVAGEDELWGQVRALEPLLDPEHSPELLREAAGQLASLMGALSASSAHPGGFQQDPRAQAVAGLLYPAVQQGDPVLLLRSMRAMLLCGSAAELGGCCAAAYRLSKDPRWDGAVAPEGAAHGLLRLATAPALQPGAAALACAALRNAAGDDAVAEELVRSGGASILARLASEQLQLVARDAAQSSDALDTAVQAVGTLQALAARRGLAPALAAAGAVTALCPAPFTDPLLRRREVVLLCGSCLADLCRNADEARRAVAAHPASLSALCGAAQLWAGDPPVLRSVAAALAAALWPPPPDDIAVSPGAAQALLNCFEGSVGQVLQQQEVHGGESEDLGEAAAGDLLRASAGLVRRSAAAARRAAGGAVSAVLALALRRADSDEVMLGCALLLAAAAPHGFDPRGVPQAAPGVAAILASGVAEAQGGALRACAVFARRAELHQWLLDSGAAAMCTALLDHPEGIIARAAVSALLPLCSVAANTRAVHQCGLLPPLADAEAAAAAEGDAETLAAIWKLYYSLADAGLFRGAAAAGLGDCADATLQRVRGLRRAPPREQLADFVGAATNARELLRQYV
eukprot:TRINITY_DN22353_c0_g1_i1.p1 TRINITY_DN22353_c0_g1~~TRINITY_DN22353_c0_g1_i1.p1  ORF type:complete len:636 (+),score=198.50 TRINITY_DN22353_c0_g1_i1:118-2025(+)